MMRVVVGGFEFILYSMETPETKREGNYRGRMF